MNITATIIVVLTLALGASGWMLKGQIQANGKLEQVVEDNQKIYDGNVAQYETSINGLNKDKAELEAINKKSEQAIAYAVTLKHKNARATAKVRREIYEIKISEVPGAECLDVPMPAELVDCLRDNSGCGAKGDNADSDKIRLPASEFDDGNTGAYFDWQNLRIPG